MVVLRNTGNTLRTVLVKVGQNYLHKINELQRVADCVEGYKMVFNNTLESKVVTDKTLFFLIQETIQFIQDGKVCFSLRNRPFVLRKEFQELFFFL